MTIDEAIQRLENRRRKMWGKRFEPDREAMQLGIEALKRCKKRQEQFPNLPHLRLLGETTD